MKKAQEYRITIRKKLLLYSEIFILFMSLRFVMQPTKRCDKILLINERGNLWIL